MMIDLFLLSVHDKHTLDYYFNKKITPMNSHEYSSLTLVKLTGVEL